MTPGPAAPTVSIIVVTYQSARDIAPCLQSIHDFAGASHEAIIVDNGSSDATRDIVARDFPWAQLMPLHQNRWYTAAANGGAGRATGRYFLFLNPDAVLTEGALTRLVSFMEAEPSVAACGPRLLNQDGSLQAAAFSYPTLLMTWLDFFPYPGRMIDSRANGRLTSRTGSPIPVDHPLGACMLVRRSAWQHVGPFDAGFVHYCEEVDWCMRAKWHGWTIAHVPSATVVHRGGASTAAVPGPSLEHLYASRSRLHRKHRGPIFRAAARFLTYLGLAHERRRLRHQALTTPSESEAARLAAIERILSTHGA